MIAGRAQLRPGGSAGAPVPPASGLFAFEEVGQDVIAQGVGGSVKGSAPVEPRHLFDETPEVPGGVKGESIDPYSLHAQRATSTRVASTVSRVGG